MLRTSRYLFPPRSFSVLGSLIRLRSQLNRQSKGSTGGTTSTFSPPGATIFINRNAESALTQETIVSEARRLLNGEMKKSDSMSDVDMRSPQYSTEVAKLIQVGAFFNASTTSARVADGLKWISQNQAAWCTVRQILYFSTPLLNLRDGSTAGKAFFFSVLYEPLLAALISLKTQDRSISSSDSELRTAVLLVFPLVSKLLETKRNTEPSSEKEKESDIPQEDPLQLRLTYFERILNLQVAAAEGLMTFYDNISRDSFSKFSPNATTAIAADEASVSGSSSILLPNSAREGTKADTYISPIEVHECVALIEAYQALEEEIAFLFEENNDTFFDRLYTSLELVLPIVDSVLGTTLASSRKAGDICSLLNCASKMRRKQDIEFLCRKAVKMLPSAFVRGTARDLCLAAQGISKVKASLSAAIDDNILNQVIESMRPQLFLLAEAQGNSQLRAMECSILTSQLSRWDVVIPEDIVSLLASQMGAQVEFSFPPQIIPFLQGLCRIDARWLSGQTRQANTPMIQRLPVIIETLSKLHRRLLHLTVPLTPTEEAQILQAFSQLQYPHVVEYFTTIQTRIESSISSQNPDQGLSSDVLAYRVVVLNALLTFCKNAVTIGAEDNEIVKHAEVLGESIARSSFQMLSTIDSPKDLNQLLGLFVRSNRTPDFVGVSESPEEISGSTMAGKETLNWFQARYLLQNDTDTRSPEADLGVLVMKQIQRVAPRCSGYEVGSLARMAHTCMDRINSHYGSDSMAASACKQEYQQALVALLRTGSTKELSLSDARKLLDAYATSNLLLSTEHFGSVPTDSLWHGDAMLLMLERFPSFLSTSTITLPKLIDASRLLQNGLLGPLSHSIHHLADPYQQERIRLGLLKAAEALLSQTQSFLESGDHLPSRLVSSDDVEIWEHIRILILLCYNLSNLSVSLQDTIIGDSAVASDEPTEVRRADSIHQSQPSWDADDSDHAESLTPSDKSSGWTSSLGEPTKRIFQALGDALCAALEEEKLKSGAGMDGEREYYNRHDMDPEIAASSHSKMKPLNFVFHPREITSKELVMLLTSFEQVDVLHITLLYALLSFIREKAVLMEPLELSLLMNSFEKLGVWNSRIMNFLASEVERKIHTDKVGVRTCTAVLSTMIKSGVLRPETDLEASSAMLPSASAHQEGEGELSKHIPLGGRRDHGLAHQALHMLAASSNRRLSELISGKAKMDHLLSESSLEELVGVVRVLSVLKRPPQPSFNGYWALSLKKIITELQLKKKERDVFSMEGSLSAKESTSWKPRQIFLALISLTTAIHQLSPFSYRARAAPSLASVVSDFIALTNDLGEWEFLATLPEGKLGELYEGQWAFRFLYGYTLPLEPSCLLPQRDNSPTTDSISSQRHSFSLLSILFDKLDDPVVYRNYRRVSTVLRSLSRLTLPSYAHLLPTGPISAFQDPRNELFDLTTKTLDFAQKRIPALVIAEVDGFILNTAEKSSSTHFALHLLCADIFNTYLLSNTGVSLSEPAQVELSTRVYHALSSVLVNVDTISGLKKDTYIPETSTKDISHSLFSASQLITILLSSALLLRSKQDISRNTLTTLPAIDSELLKIVAWASEILLSHERDFGTYNNVKLLLAFSIFEEYLAKCDANDDGKSFIPAHSIGSLAFLGCSQLLPQLQRVDESGLQLLPDLYRLCCSGSAVFCRVVTRDLLSDFSSPIIEKRTRFPTTCQERKKMFTEILKRSLYSITRSSKAASQKLAPSMSNEYIHSVYFLLHNYTTKTQNDALSDILAELHEELKH